MLTRVDDDDKYMHEAGDGQGGADGTCRIVRLYRFDGIATFEDNESELDGGAVYNTDKMK